MRKLRDLFVVLLVIAGFGVSLNLLRVVVGVTSPWFGSVVMLYVTGLAAVASPLFLLRQPRFLRELHEWESEGRICAALGVPAFGALLRNTPLRHLNSKVYLRGHAGIAAVLAQIEAAEAAHSLAAIVLVPWLVYAFVQGRFMAASALLAVQIIYNLYPIMHLRSARVRLGRSTS